MLQPACRGECYGCHSILAPQLTIDSEFAGVSLENRDAKSAGIPDAGCGILGGDEIEQTLKRWGNAAGGRIGLAEPKGRGENTGGN